jgi:hypothetical protein
MHCEILFPCFSIPCTDILIQIDAALLCASPRMRMPRRAAFYFRRAAQLYAEMYQWRAAHQIFLLAAHAYRLQIFADEREEHSPSRPFQHTSSAGGVCTTIADGRNRDGSDASVGARAWPALRRSLLLDLIQARGFDQQLANIFFHHSFFAALTIQDILV